MVRNLKWLGLGVALTMAACGGEAFESPNEAAATEEDALSPNCGWDKGSDVKGSLAVYSDPIPGEPSKCYLDRIVSYIRFDKPSCSRKYFATLYAGDGTWLDTMASQHTSLWYWADAETNSIITPKGSKVCIEGRIYDSIQPTSKSSGVVCGIVDCAFNSDPDYPNTMRILQKTFFKHNY